MTKPLCYGSCGPVCTNGPTCRPLTAELGFPPVLDACCGSRMFWFDRKDSRATFVDKRRERHTLPDISSKGGSRELVVDPVFPQWAIDKYGIEKCKRAGELAFKGGGTNSTPRIHTPPEFRDLLLAIARSANKASNV